MTTALQKYDIGRVFPTQDNLLALLGQAIAAWVAANNGLVAAEPAADANKLVLAKNIHAAIMANAQALMGEFTSRMDNLATTLHETISNTFTSQGIIGTLVDNGVNLEDLATALGVQDNETLAALRTLLDSANGRLDAIERDELGPLKEFIEAYNEEVLKGDIIAAILAADDDRKVSIYDYLELREFPEAESQTNKHILQLYKVNQEANGGTDLNKNWCCITSTGCELTLVLPTNGVVNGDSLYLEYRSTGADHAPLVEILTEGQYENRESEQQGNDTDKVIISEDFEPSEWGPGQNRAHPDYTIVRAKFYQGRWVAEVVPFFDNDQGQQQTTYAVRYTTDYSTAPWPTYEETCQQGPYTLAGKKADYCGMQHVGWYAMVNGQRQDYGFHETVELSDSTTVEEVEGKPRVLELHAKYASSTLDLRPSDPPAPANMYGSAERYEAVEMSIGFPNETVSAWGENYIQVEVGAWIMNHHLEEAWYIMTTEGPNPPYYPSMPARSENTSILNYSNYEIRQGGVRLWDGHDSHCAPGNGFGMVPRNSSSKVDPMKLTLRRSSSSEDFEMPTIYGRKYRGLMLPVITKITFPAEDPEQ